MKVSISIIIPIYNMEQYIGECLESILCQTILNFEVICIDDCSTDNSKEKILHYVRNDNRIKCLSLHINSGSGVARNMGIKYAKGDFLAFMDPDDYYYENTTLEFLYKLAIKYNVDAVAGNMIKFNHISGEKKPYTHMYFSRDSIMNFNDYLFYGGYTRFIFRTKVIKENHIYFPKYKRRQDPVFFYKVMTTIGKIYTSSRNVYVYRVSHKTIPWSYEQISDAVKSYTDNLKLLLKHKLYCHYRIEINDFKQKFLMNKSLIVNESIKKKYQVLSKNIKYMYLKKSIPQCLEVHEKSALDNFFFHRDVLDKRNSYIIYGFGNLGNTIYEQMKNEYIIVGIVDEAFIKGLVVDSHIVQNSLNGYNLFNCKIIITPLNKKVQKEIGERIKLLYRLRNDALIFC